MYEIYIKKESRTLDENILLLYIKLIKINFEFSKSCILCYIQCEESEHKKDKRTKTKIIVFCIKFKK